MRNIRIRVDVKEGGRDYSQCGPEDMDWDAVGQGILRYRRWRTIFLAIGGRW